jgi:IS5 family transposase
MVRRTYVQRSLFEILLPDGDQLWDPVLRRIDEVLEDEEMIDRVMEAMARRWPRSRVRGRPGTPAAVVLRMLVLKHLYDWSFDECEREVRGSLVYRAFCRIDCQRVPDAKTIIRLAHLLGAEVLKGLMERLVMVARQRRVIRGLRMRADTTVVETNVHYPTDSRLLADGVRVLTRTMKRLSQALGKQAGQVRDRSRSVARRVFEIAQLSRHLVGEQTQRRLCVTYRKLMGVTRAVVRQVEALTTQHVTSAAAPVKRLCERLHDTVGRVRRVLAQTRARVLRGDTHFPDKLLSLFEPHTEAIRQGKAAQPTEFGKLVKLQEAEAQFITDYQVCTTRVPDLELWIPALERHRQLFGRVPRLATADVGFASTTNERAAAAMGVHHVALPRRGRLSTARRTHQRQRWFRRALCWRTGCEGRVSALN